MRNFGDVAAVPLTLQSGANTASLKVSEEFGLLQVVTTLFGPQSPSSDTVTFALLIDNCVALSACPVHGVVPVALPVISPQAPPPVNCVDVIDTIPVGVIVPLNVAVQFALIAPLLRLDIPDAEKGSPPGFIGWPSARVTVTAKAGRTSVDDRTKGAAIRSMLRIFMTRSSLDNR